MIDPIPPLPPGLKEAALRGTLIPFIGAGASRLAGCPNWIEFADRALCYFVDQGKFSHGQRTERSNSSERSSGCSLIGPRTDRASYDILVSARDSWRPAG